MTKDQAYKMCMPPSGLFVANSTGSMIYQKVGLMILHFIGDTIWLGVDILRIKNAGTSVFT